MEEVVLTSSITQPNKFLYIFRNDGVEVEVVISDGEIIHTSRILTFEERRAINNYILRKWNKKS